MEDKAADEFPLLCSRSMGDSMKAELTQVEWFEGCRGVDCQTLPARRREPQMAGARERLEVGSDGCCCCRPAQSSCRGTGSRSWSRG